MAPELKAPGLNNAKLDLYYYAAYEWGPLPRMPAGCKATVRALGEACVNGRFESAAWIADTFSLKRKDVAKDILAHVCRSGRIAAVKWLVERFAIAHEDMQPCRRDSALRVACRWGHLELAQWLADRDAEKNWLDVGDVLCDACKRGRLGVRRAAMQLAKFSPVARASARGGAEGDGDIDEGDDDRVARWLVSRFVFPDDALQRAFRAACASAGDAVCWLLDRPECGPAIPDAFVDACENDLIDVAQLLAGRVSADTLDRGLATACRYSHFATAQWVAGRAGVGLTPARWATAVYGDGSSPNVQRVFVEACKTGGLELAQWVAAAARDTVAHVRVHAFARACGDGHIAVARWAAREFGITTAEAIAVYMFGDDEWDSAFTDACKLRDDAARPHPVVEWIADEFRLTADDLRAEGHSAFIEACGYGRADTAKWLVARFGLTAADAQARDNAALAGAIEDDQIRVARWLVDAMGCDVRAVGNAAFRDICRRGRTEMAGWLASQLAPIDPLPENGSGN